MGYIRSHNTSYNIILYAFTHQGPFGCSLSLLSGRTSHSFILENNQTIFPWEQKQCAFNRKGHIFQMTRNLHYLNTVLT